MIDNLGYPLHLDASLDLLVWMVGAGEVVFASEYALQAIRRVE
jgi:hypothetical protein